MTRSFHMAIAFSAILLAGVSLHAQNGTSARWDPLPDSLFLIWNLEQDQVRRLRVIEEDHEADRTAILADKALSPADRDQRLNALATARKREIKAVLQVKQFEDWERRCQAAAR